MKIIEAYYPKHLPNHIMLVMPDGKHYCTSTAPFRQIQENELHALPGYDAQKPERFLGEQDKVPAYALRFYGLEK